MNILLRPRKPKAGSWKLETQTATLPKGKKRIYSPLAIVFGYRHCCSALPVADFAIIKYSKHLRNFL